MPVLTEKFRFAANCPFMTDTLVITNNYMDCILERISKKTNATTRIRYKKGFQNYRNKDCI